MARPILLSNGDLHVGLDANALVNDFYYPYVGQENHAARKHLRHRIGVWVDGVISWLDDGTWKISSKLAERALIGHTSAFNADLKVLLEFDDCVDSREPAFLRNIHVVNAADTPREIKLFMHQAFIISDVGSNTDTVQYLPDSNAILHYRGDRAFIISGINSDGGPFDEHSMGIFGIEGHEGTWRDAEDGTLGGNNVEHGRVDSVVGFYSKLQAHDSTRVSYWIAAGQSIREALGVDKTIRTNGFGSRIKNVSSAWHAWTKPLVKTADKLAKPLAKSLYTNALILAAHLDNRGAVIASTDGDMLNYSRDAYAYCWPRDGAYVLWPLIRLGYQHEPLRFFDFIKQVLHPNGYVMHKYFADGSLGPSWHPYIQNGEQSPPIQIDETAIIVFMIGEYEERFGTALDLKMYYHDLIKPMANFLSGYIDEDTYLPRASYDLWEEVYLSTTYSISVVYGALRTAARLADKLGEHAEAVVWGTTADEIYANRDQLFDRDKGYFVKGIRRNADNSLHVDTTIDLASFYGAFTFGLFELESDEVATSIKTIERELMPNGFAGIGRYINDNYNRVASSGPGNPWFVTSLWVAQYYLRIGEVAKADEIIEWTHSHALESGVLSEQIDRATGGPLSVAPLAWSHAELINTLIDRAMVKGEL